MSASPATGLCPDRPGQAHFFDTASGLRSASGDERAVAPPASEGQPRRDQLFRLEGTRLTWPISSSGDQQEVRHPHGAARPRPDIADGEFFVLLGETGAGKTTTLRLIAGLEKPTAARCFIDGVDVADWGAAERDVALVLQQYSLYPRYTVRENLEFPLKSKIRRVAGRRDQGARRARGARRCASSTCWIARPTGCRAARCSASRSAAPSCASRASS